MQSGVRHLLREALIWGLFAVAGIAGFVYFDDIKARLSPDTAAVQQEGSHSQPIHQAADDLERVVRLSADRSGHFRIEAHINDRPITLLADTGATSVTLTYEDARDAGLSPASLSFTQQMQTANGIARAAPVVIDRIRVGDIELRNVRALVSEPGKLHVSLLGMSFLGALTRFEMRGRELVLIQ